MHGLVLPTRTNNFCFYLIFQSFNDNQEVFLLKKTPEEKVKERQGEDKRGGVGRGRKDKRKKESYKKN